ncbi:MAG: hypothetical protein ACLUDL_20990 [Eubacterium callanderi]|uniref:hypothetical protein n=1 Tax=Eubacterium callanderi TaxID=53442 RepID=UPI0039941C2F
MKLNNRFIFGILSLYWQVIAFVALPTIAGRPTGKRLSASPNLCSKASRSRRKRRVVEVGG